MKKCSKCGSEKEIKEFTKNKRSKDGLCSWCKQCHKAKSDSHYAENKQKVIDRSIKQHKENPEKYKFTKHKYLLKAKYKLTPEEYSRKLLAQGGGCAICGGVNEDGDRLPVDHDHNCCPGQITCGKCVRGLLCNKCNHGLGNFKDDISTLTLAIRYLSAWKTILKVLVIFLVTSLAQAYTWDQYNAAFLAFAHRHNKDISNETAQQLASLNWGLAKHRWAAAVRFAEMEGAESGLLVMACILERDSYKHVPRSDFVGAHYNLFEQQMKKNGFWEDQADWYYSDEFDLWKQMFTKDPVFGTFIVLTAYADKAEKVGLDRASHWWQTGNDGKPDSDDVYLTSLNQQHKIFMKYVSGIPAFLR